VVWSDCSIGSLCFSLLSVLLIDWITSGRYDKSAVNLSRASQYLLNSRIWVRSSVFSHDWCKFDSFSLYSDVLCQNGHSNSRENDLCTTDCINSTGCPRQRMLFKTAILVFQCLNGQPPPYYSDDYQLASDVRLCRLHLSDSVTCVVDSHNSYGDQCFAPAGPMARVWNSVLVQLNYDNLTE